MMILFAKQTKKISDSSFLEDQAMAYNNNINNRSGGSNESAAANNDKTKRWNTVTKTMLLVTDANEN